MLAQRLPPGVKDRRDADRAAHVPRIAPEGEEREDDMEVRNGQQVGLARREPPLLGEGLTLGTMAIATRVIGDACRAAVVTRLPMPAEDGGAAGRNRPQRPVLPCREPMRPPIGIAMRADDVGQLESRTGDRASRALRHGAHGLGLWPRGKPLEQIERRVRPHLRVTSQLKVASCRTDVPVAKQPLNGVDVDTGFEQMRRKRVTENGT